MEAGAAGKFTYYLTYFECLSENTLELVFAFHNFVERLIIHLGEDWRIESNLLWDEYHKKEDPEGCSNIFNVYLMVFLKGRISCEVTPSTKSESVMLQEYQDRVVMEFARTLEGTKPQQLRNTLSFKTLSVGFFVTAIQLWDASFGHLQKQRKTPNGQLKPLIICVQQDEEQPNPRKMRKLSTSNRTESMCCNLEKLELVSESAKNEAEAKDNPKRAREVSFSWKQFDSDNCLPSSLLEKSRQAMEQTIKCEKWQLVSTFIINMLQVTYDRDGKRHLIRIIRICREFYQSAVMIWMLFNAKKNYCMNFKQYQAYVKYILQSKWEHSYTLPLKVIFTILCKEWNQIVKEHAIDLNEDNEVIKIFLARVRDSLHESWSSKIMTINPEVFT